LASSTASCRSLPSSTSLWACRSSRTSSWS
jgi:hypothetical protein